MRYPDEFNTPTFPAGPRIAVARVMSIAILVVFALIIALGGGIYWASKSRHIHPFLVTVDEITGSWQVVGHDHGARTISTNRALQESVIANFIKNWYAISANQNENDDMWYGYEKRDECSADNRLARAEIFCASGEELYNYFIQTVVPDYQVRIADGETWSVDVNNIYLNEVYVTDNGGTWRALAQVDSNTFGPIQIMAYIKLGRDTSLYPSTLGFYVVDYNAYRIGQ